MSVRTYLTILVMACLTGGYIVEYVVSQRLSQNAELATSHQRYLLIKKDFDHLRLNAKQLLVSADLIFGSGETYLTGGAINQATLIGEQFDKITERANAVIPAELTRRFSQNLEDVGALLQEAITATDSNRQAKLDILLESYDGRSVALVTDLEDAKSHFDAYVIADAERLAAARARAKLVAQIARIVFAMMVAALWFWANRQISNPIAQLADMATRAQDNYLFTGVSRAPAEVLRLSERFVDLTDKLLRQAKHDPLTNLYNRREFERQLSATIKERRDVNATPESAVFYIDLDHFKIVNDTCGHAAGDEMLTRVASVLTQNVRENDVVARLGGDEFAVVVRNCPQQKAIDLAESIRAQIDRISYTWGSESFGISASIGVCIVLMQDDNLDDIINSVDTACAAAKKSGRNCVHVIRPEDTGAADRRSEMLFVNKLHNALRESRFALFYQNIVPVVDHHNDDQHFEILTRMLDSNGELVMPTEFIPVMESFGMGSRFDSWVLRAVVTDLTRDKAILDRIGCCSVNLSGQSLNDDSFANFVKEILEEFDFPAEKLCFEITETAAVSDSRNATALITAMKQHGIRFSLDDFGAAHSSFGYLKSLPVDYIKIDGSFVQGMEANALDLETVKSVINLAKVGNKRTIAEFVDSTTLHMLLVELGVDYVQGYLHGKPAPLSEKLQQLVDENRNRSPQNRAPSMAIASRQSV